MEVTLDLARGSSQRNPGHMLHERVVTEAVRESTRRNTCAQASFQLAEAAQKVRIEVLSISSAPIESRTAFRAFDGVVNHAG